MKKTLKRVIPLLLILTLLAGGYWFFFRYRVDLTTRLLRSFADSQFNSGHYSTAIRCYRWANELSPQNADYAMKLAEAYHKSGNYTKTEYVLVNAIKDAPADVRLYETLSRIYVEQDKLLDAQKLLDNVSDADAMATLSAERPAAPILSPEADYYSEYIAIELQQSDADATCYFTLDGAYPSQGTDVYSGPITLRGGKTTVNAVAVNDSGLVSPLTTGEYTIAGVVEDVSFHDQALLAYVQELLLRGDRTIRTDDLWDIEELSLPAEIENTEDLPLFTGLKRLIGRDLGDLDYGFLASMPELNYLELENCVVTTKTLEQIAACPNLETLVLTNCGLNSVEALTGMKPLRVLDLSENSINSLISVAAVGFENLEELYLGHNALTQLPDLHLFPSLKILDLSYNALSYAGGLSSCPTLERLNLSHNRISSVTPVSALRELVWLNASNNQIEDVSMLAPCTKLESFLMTDNKLKDVGFLSNCGAIREVYIDNNDVVKAPAFPAACPLETFSAIHNFLDDLSGLSGLQNLKLVNADYNNIKDISALLDCPALVQVNVYHTNVHEGGELAEKGVVVNFTPEFE